jgi:pimeloyl-ACP methyl ester carboxylesterase
MEKLRVLCLHGYNGNAQTLRRQMAPLVDGLDDMAEFVCVDAPSLAAGDFGWWHAKAIKGTAAGARRYEGWPRTREAIISIFARQGPFDGVFGFSQGAALAALLVGSRARNGAVERDRLIDDTGLLRFDFAAMVGGFVAADPDLARLYDYKSNDESPSVHIVGRSDAIVPRDASLALAAKFNGPLILEHDGGHVIASTPPVRRDFRGFLEGMRRRKARTGAV